MGNLHPIFVHFPIALLSLYAVMELISFGRLKSRSEWFWMKFILVTLGGISVLLARQTGELSASFVSDVGLRPLIEKHEQFANIVAGIFGILAAGYVFEAVKILNIRWLIGLWPSFWQFLFQLQKLITRTSLSKLLALAGLAALLITGALGGTLVYGPDSDPFTRYIYDWLF